MTPRGEMRLVCPQFTPFENQVPSRLQSEGVFRLKGAPPVSERLDLPSP